MNAYPVHVNNNASFVGGMRKLSAWHTVSMSIPDRAFRRMSLYVVKSSRNTFKE